MLLDRELGDASAMAEVDESPNTKSACTCALVIAAKALSNAVGSGTRRRSSATPNDGAALPGLQDARLGRRPLEHRHAGHPGHHLLEQFQPFRGHLHTRLETPVTLPPGRARLATNPPKPPAPTTTIGMVLVACVAILAAAACGTTMTSTWRRSTSATRVANWSSPPPSSATRWRGCRPPSIRVHAARAGTPRPRAVAQRPTAAGQTRETRSAVPARAAAPSPPAAARGR